MSGFDTTIGTIVENEVNKLLSSICDHTCEFDHLLQTSSILSTKFLDGSFSKSLGRKILATLFPQLSSSFNDILTRLPANVEDASLTIPSLTTELQNLIKVIRCTDSLIRQLMTIVSKFSSIQLQQIPTVSLHTISILKKSFRHCKDSEKLYGKFFKNASGTLGILFQETYTLQKRFGFILSKLKYVKEDDNCTETQHYAIQICEGLLEICSIISGMDKILLGTAWKLFFGFLSAFKEIVITKLPIISYVALLCENIQGCVEYTIQLSTQSSHLLTKGDESTQKAFVTSCKFSVFFMSLLATSCEQYGPYFNEDVFEKIISFVYDIHTLILSTKFASFNLEELNESEMSFISDLFSNVKKILQSLLCLENFTMHFTLTYLQRRVLAPNHIYLLLSLCKTLTSDQGIIEKWLVSNITSEKCLMALLLEQIMELYSHHGSPTSSFLCHCLYPNLAQDSKLFDTIVTSVCALISSSPTCLDVLEEPLIRNMFSQDPFRSMLSCDILAFVCKSSETLCEQYFMMFHEIVHVADLPTEIPFTFVIICNFLTRISSTFSQEFVQRFSNKNGQIFIHDYPALPRYSTEECLHDISETLVEGLKTWLDGEHKLSDLHRLNLSLDKGIKLFNMHQNNNAAVFQKREIIEVLDLVDSMLDDILLPVSMEFWKKFSSSMIVSRFINLCVECCKLRKNPISSGIIEKLLLFFEMDVSNECKMNIVELLPRCVSYNETSHLQEQIFKIIVDSILINKWRTRYAALDVFEIISRTSNGTSLLEKCAQFPDIVKHIESHMSFESFKAMECCDGMRKKQKKFLSILANDNLFELVGQIQSESQKKFIEVAISYQEDGSNFENIVLQHMRDLNAKLIDFEALLSSQSMKTVSGHLNDEIIISKTLFNKIANLLHC